MMSQTPAATPTLQSAPNVNGARQPVADATAAGVSSISVRRARQVTFVVGVGVGVIGALALPACLVLLLVLVLGAVVFMTLPRAPREPEYCDCHGCMTPEECMGLNRPVPVARPATVAPLFPTQDRRSCGGCLHLDDLKGNVGNCAVDGRCHTIWDAACESREG